MFGWGHIGTLAKAMTSGTKWYKAKGLPQWPLAGMKYICKSIQVTPTAIND